MVMMMMIMKKNKIINKKAKETKKCVIKQKLMFENYKDYLFNNKTIINTKTINFDDYVNENKTEHNKN